jgi:uncharacterized phosphosugar-binding protein
LVHLFGSGHSVIPVLDVFPRYGSFAGFHPLMDSRLMWTQVLSAISSLSRWTPWWFTRTAA